LINAATIMPFQVNQWPHHVEPGISWQVVCKAILFKFWTKMVVKFFRGLLMVWCWSSLYVSAASCLKYRCLMNLTPYYSWEQQKNFTRNGITMLLFGAATSPLSACSWKYKDSADRDREDDRAVPRCPAWIRASIEQGTSVVIEHACVLNQQYFGAEAGLGESDLAQRWHGGEARRTYQNRRQLFLQALDLTLAGTATPIFPLNSTTYHTQAVE
jgi:hypothetical protein